MQLSSISSGTRLKVIIASIVSLVLLPLIAILVNSQPANAAGETFSYVENGSKITATKGLFGNSNVTFSKQPFQNGGKDEYRGSAKIAGPNNTSCNIGLQILVSPGGTSGAISAPAVLNGIPGAGNSGQNYTPSCDKSFAAGVSDLNKTVSIGTGSTNNPAPEQDETEGQREVIVRVYSPLPNSQIPKSSITRTAISGNPSTSTKDLKWSAANSVSTAIWANVSAGTTSRYCITPTGVFDTTDCKTATKERGKALVVTFGNFENSYNEEGKKVDVTVNMAISAATVARVFGPVSLTIFNASTSTSVGTATTNSNPIGDGTGQVPAQTITLAGSFDGIEPGTYKVCVTNQDICSANFTKETNMSASTTITISAEQSEQFLSTEGASTCVIPGVGWIVCPIVSFLADIADSAFVFLSDNFLRVDIQTVSPTSGTYSAWQIMRSFANVGFVILFLIIIFSQLTGQGISNYGIKKMLPRLVVTAILVNTSFLICQLAVDLSNIIGVSIKAAFDAIGGGLEGGTYNPGDDSGNWIGIATAVLAGAGIAWALGLSVILPFLIGAVVALVMVFIILVVRQMLIILLTVIAPLAFIAFLLPNTEQWFKKWRQMFTALLLVFPVIGLLFGAAGLASKILATVYAGTGNIIGQTVAAAILVLPLFLLPSLLKGSLNAIPVIGNKLNGMSTKLSGGAKSRAAGSGIMKNFAANKAQKRASISTGTYGGRNPLSKLRSRGNQMLNNSRAFNTVTGGFGADRTLAGQGQQRKDTQEAMAMFGGDDTLVESWAESGGNLAVALKLNPKLTTGQQEQFKLMQNAGHASKPTSFLAAAQYMSEGGKGSTSAMASAVGRAASSGASSAQVSSSWEAAKAAYRKAGRGDIVGEMGAHQEANGGNVPLGTDSLQKADPTKVTAARQKGWQEVDPGSVHREALKTAEGLQSYRGHLSSNVDHLTQALSGYDRMEGRAKTLAHDEILKAAQAHQSQSTQKASSITNIQEAKTYFKIK